MSFALVINSQNLVGNGNNTFQYNFIGNTFTIPEGSEMMVTNIQIPYSFYNISQAYGNNSITLNFPNNSAGYTAYNWTIPDGFYTVSSLNFWLQQQMIANNLYLVNTSTGQNVYFISIVVNTFQYGNQVLAYTVPLSLYAGYSIPTNGSFTFPTGVARTPYLTIPKLLSTPTIGTLLGFGSTSATTNIPAANSTTNTSSNSTMTPMGSIINSLILRCSLVNNKVTSPFDILDSFSIPNGTTFGQNINYTPQVSKWVKISNGTFNSFIITFTDQNLNVINANDPNILVTLLLKFPKNNIIK